MELILEIRFEWDKKKQISNIEKHGIDFNDIVDVWENHSIEFADLRKNYGEPRFIKIIKIDKLYLQIVFTPRGDNIRLISARRASTQERRIYEERI